MKTVQVSDCLILFYCILILQMTSGCSVGPDFVPPSAPTVQNYTPNPAPDQTVATGGVSQEFIVGEELAADWWLLYRCEPLTKIVEAVLDGNQNLRATRARLRQSQDLLRAGYGVFFPQLDGGLEASRQKINSGSFGGGGDSTTFTLYSANLSVTYNLDLFGRSQRQVESKAAKVDLQLAQLRATYLTLLGNAVNAVIAQAGYRTQLEASQGIVETERHQVAIVHSQVEAGMVPETELLSLRTQLASTEATLPVLRQNLDRTRHLLAGFSGRFPAEADLPEPVLDDFSLPAELPVSLPSDLVRQRPDILAAEAALHSASADIGVATADLYPRISLSAGFGRESARPGKLFDSASNVWNLVTGLTQPLFHGGSLRYQRQAAIDAYDAALADYRQTVLDAFVQVADALRTLQHDAEILKASSDGLADASRNLDLSRTNYRAGIANYLEVLVADQQYQKTHNSHIQVRTKMLQDTAVLLIALGGGWWNLPEPISLDPEPISRP